MGRCITTTKKQEKLNGTNLQECRKKDRFVRLVVVMILGDCVNSGTVLDRFFAFDKLIIAHACCSSGLMKEKNLEMSRVGVLVFLQTLELFVAIMTFSLWSSLI